MTDPDVEVFRQPLTVEGITVGDDVWIGSHVVILDGVQVGDRSVIAAGAVVTRDVPAGAIADAGPGRITLAVEAQPWAGNAWGAGHRVDIVGTAIHFNRRRGNPGRPGTIEALFGWLSTRPRPSEPLASLPDTGVVCAAVTAMAGRRRCRCSPEAG